MTNPAGVETSPYVDGSLPELIGGTHRVLLTVQTPVEATHHHIEDDTITEYGADGISTVIGTRFTIIRGSTREVDISFRLPKTVRALQVAPSARVEPVAWTVNGVRYDDDQRFVAPLGSFPDPVDERSVLTSWTAVLVALAGLGFMLSSARHEPGDASASRLGRIDASLGTGLYAVALGLALVAVALA